ncbi:CCDC90 family protein [Thiorhodovibrio frisius]|uniref:DUF1640 domain-containing protein n=1 Tax=Thiorhodovibrio frisius TaxID=631362 RepID=H8Z5A0_9GAMM|nr:hypothetical protein [Thiorhodovibrio frisius]EIC20507.1 hypothetical protein Thi970DRAFT_04147 [Thiorhodovibrio frisius]WPL21250.1 hypothetical protein Thiofri_01362 [Thiorhodovibrio frisius]
MTAISFDTLRFVETLKDHGLNDEQAKGIAAAYRDASGEAEIATKRDIERLEAQLIRVDTRFAGEMTLMKWMLGILLGGVVALILKSFFP